MQYVKHMDTPPLSTLLSIPVTVAATITIALTSTITDTVPVIRTIPVSVSYKGTHPFRT
jgi:hypothetical protein